MEGVEAKPADGRTGLVSACAGLFLIIFGLRLGVDNDVGGEIVSLFVIPVALLAAEYGRRAGVAAGCLAFGLVIAWVQLQSIETGALGHVSSGITFIGIGAIVGQFSTSRARERLLTMHRLNRLARTDELTDLPNRRAWEDTLERDLARAGRERTSAAVGILDLDHFKAFNDSNGHPAGDDLLRKSAQSWIRLLRDSDLIARIGGEEFGVLLNHPGDDAAIEIMLERIRIATPGGETCSIGAVRWDGRESAGQLMHRADVALYAAKEAGRNRVIVAETKLSVADSPATSRPAGR